MEACGLCLQVATNKRYAAASGQGFTVSEVARSVEADFGKIDIIVHSLANGPEVTKPLLETSRKVCLCPPLARHAPCKPACNTIMCHIMVYHKGSVTPSACVSLCGD